MAWTSPFTAATTLITDAIWNSGVRDNFKALAPTDQMEWTSYTPTLVQSVTVTKTVNYAKYWQIGKTVHVVVRMTVTGSGSSNNKIFIGLPVAAASTSFFGVTIGAGGVYDTSVGNLYPGLPEMETTTTICLMDSTQATVASTSCLGLTGTALSTALQVGDVVFFSATYEVA